MAAKNIGGVNHEQYLPLNPQGNLDFPTATARLPSSAATTNSTLVKNGALTVYAVEAYNASAAVKYLKLYDKGSAAPVVGTDAPRRTIALKSGDRLTLTFPCGLVFANGLGFALTGAAADADTTALAAGDVTALNIDYA